MRVLKSIALIAFGAVAGIFGITIYIWTGAHDDLH